MIREEINRSHKSNSIAPKPPEKRTTFTFSYTSSISHKPTNVSVQKQPQNSIIEIKRFIKNHPHHSSLKEHPLSQLSNVPVTKKLRRKKIFQNQSTSLPRNLSFKDITSKNSIKYYEEDLKRDKYLLKFRKRQKRNAIFSSYRHSNSEVKLIEPNKSQIKNHLYSVQQPAHPQSLIEYINLAHHRNKQQANNINRRSVKSQDPKGIKAQKNVDQMRHPDSSSQRFQQGNKYPSQDNQILESKDISLNNFVETVSVYDQNNSSEKPSLPHLEISKSAQQYIKIVTPKKPAKTINSFRLFQSEKQESPLTFNKMTLPNVLIIFGLLLFLIQTIK